MNKKILIIFAILPFLSGACSNFSKFHTVQQAKQTIVQETKQSISQQTKRDEPSDKSVSNWRRIEVTHLIWRVGSTSLAIIEANGGEDSAHLRIQTAGNSDFVLAVPGGLVNLSEGIMNADLLKLNTLASSYIFVAKNLKTNDGTTIIAVTGWAYASDPGSIRFISVNASGKPYELFSSDTFELADLKDIDNDGLIEIIGKHALSQKWGRCFTTYDPFSVYHIPLHSVEKVFRSLDLSKRYNLAHYYGWVGAEPSEDWAVVLCAPGGPKIVKAEEAEKQFGK
jgi:hypothetical protein